MGPDFMQIFVILGGHSSIFSHSGATYHFCHLVAETISVKFAEHSYQHSVPDLALIVMCMFVILVGQPQKVHSEMTKTTFDLWMRNTEMI